MIVSYKARLVAEDIARRVIPTYSSAADFRVVVDDAADFAAQVAELLHHRDLVADMIATPDDEESLWYWRRHSRPIGCALITTDGPVPYLIAGRCRVYLIERGGGSQ